MDKKETKEKSEEKFGTAYALGLAWELGYTIAIPIVLFALGGSLLDKSLGTSPLFLLAGIVFSIIMTSWLVYRKTQKFLK